MFPPMSAPRRAELPLRGGWPDGPMSPLLVAVLAHVIALSGVFLLPMIGLTLPLMAVALIEGVASAVIGRILRLPAWWLPINVLFLPAVLLVRNSELAPAWYLAGFCLLALFFWSTFRTRVPLYLSSVQACERLIALIPANGMARVLDLGCGVGGVMRRGARARPKTQFTGLELAPLPALVAWWRMRGVRNAAVVRGDFWKHDLAGYDVVYAFLSPVVMQALWRKARAEMKSGNLFVSNSFDVEGVKPDWVMSLPGRDSHVYVWRM